MGDTFGVSVTCSDAGGGGGFHGARQLMKGLPLVIRSAQNLPVCPALVYRRDPLSFVCKINSRPSHPAPPPALIIPVSLHCKLPHSHWWRSSHTCWWRGGDVVLFQASCVEAWMWWPAQIIL